MAGFTFLFKQMKIRDSQVEALQVEKIQLDSQLWEINAKYNQVSIHPYTRHAITPGFAISMHILALPPPPHTHTHTPMHTHIHTRRKRSY